MSWTQYVPRDKLSITVSCQLGWTCPPHFSCLCFPQRSQAGPAQLTKSGSGRKQPASAHLEAAGPVTTTRVTSKSDPWTLLPQLVSSSFPCLFPATPTVQNPSSKLDPVTRHCATMPFQDQSPVLFPGLGSDHPIAQQSTCQASLNHATPV